MRLGLMQPYFFPYIGYFELIHRTDRWGVFDIVKYNRKSWMSRNRILHPTSGWQYVTVPVRHAPRETLIRDVCVVSRRETRDRILGQLEHYRRRAPYFRQVCDLVKDGFDRGTSPRLVDLNVDTLSATCARLGIDFTPEYASRLDLPLTRVEHPGRWALEICRELGATDYLNPPGGYGIFRPEEWRESGIGLAFTNLPDLRYTCAPYSFCENLSILDVLMWLRPEDARASWRSRTDRVSSV